MAMMWMYVYGMMWVLCIYGVWDQLSCMIRVVLIHCVFLHHAAFALHVRL